MTNQALYGPFVISDITHYADLEDLKELLRWKFHMAIGESQPPWTLQTDNSGDFRVWAPAAITEDEKRELYRKNAERRSTSNILSFRRY